MEGLKHSSYGIQSMRYFKHSSIIEIICEDGTYHCYDVPEREYHALIAASSIGSGNYFVNHLLDRYKYNKIS